MLVITRKKEVTYFKEINIKEPIGIKSIKLECDLVIVSILPQHLSVGVTFTEHSVLLFTYIHILHQHHWVKKTFIIRSFEN